MKKWMAVLLAAIMVLALTACSSDASNLTADGLKDLLEAVASTPAPGEEETKTKVPTEEPTAAKPVAEAPPAAPEPAAEAPAVEPEPAIEESPAPQEGGDDTIVLEPTLVVENDQCLVRIDGYAVDEIWGNVVKVYLENKSEDKNYTFTVDRATVNGVECGALFVEEVTAGKKANGELSFIDNDLEENGITKYTDIGLTFRAYDSDDWSADDIFQETIRIYPYGEEKAAPYVREPLDTDMVLVDNEYATIIATGYEMDEIWGYTVKLYMVNKSDKTIRFTEDKASVNGYMMDPLFITSLAPGNCAFSSMSWSMDSLEENHIEVVEEIEFTLKIRDDEDWMIDDFIAEKIILKPQ